MNHWLVKSEPFKWSWDHMVKAKRTHWDGVRNYQASNNLKAMKIGDHAFFYHSNEGLEVVGIVEVCELSRPDSTAEGDARWDCVHIKAVCDVPVPVTLKDVKSNPKLSDMSLVTSMRLSVQPVLLEEYLEVCRMGKLDKPPHSPD